MFIMNACPVREPLAERSADRSLVRAQWVQGVYFGCALGLLAALAIRFQSGRSLWLDEAWVANSATAPSLHDVFFYPHWLQTSPPLFLLMVRAAVRIFGSGNTALRAVPMIMGAVSALLMWRIVSRVLTRPFALLAWTSFAFSPAAFEYALTLKQYSSEVAASAVVLLVCIGYLRQPSGARFWLLAGTIGIGLLAAYSLVFVLPLVALVLLARGMHQRALTLIALASSVFVAEYFLLISRNTSAALRAFWAPDFFPNVFASGRDLLWLLPLPDRLLLQATFVGCGAAALCLAGLVLALCHGRRRIEIQVLCGGPCLLVCGANYYSIYPMTARTELFLLPFLVVLLFSDLQLVTHSLPARTHRRLQPSLGWILIAGTLLAVVAGARKIDALSSQAPEEDAASAISFLRDHVRPGDTVWVPVEGLWSVF